jgi:ABC-type phosphate transport system substrate-binding protein
MLNSAVVYVGIARISVPDRHPRHCIEGGGTVMNAVIVVPSIVIALAWLVVSVPRWRQVSWHDQTDTPINFLPKEARLDGLWAAAWTVMVHHREIILPSLVQLRVRNSGLTAISKARTRRPVSFTFPGRDVVEYAIVDLRGISKDEIAPAGTAASITGNRILLPRFPMPRGGSFKLLVLLSGPGRGVHGKGRFRGGRMVHEARGRGPVARNVVFGTVLALLAGTQAGLMVGRGPAIPASCGNGALAIAGSSAFEPVAQQIAEAYSAVCLDARISVSASSSVGGLNALVASGGLLAAGGQKERPDSVQIAMSDGRIPDGYQGLVGQPIGVIIFAVVVNRQAAVFNLTVDQLRGVFTGKITNWQQVGGADLPVRVVARASGSGTRRTFDRKILNGPSEPVASSFDCVSKNAVPGSPMIRCEVPDTATLLQRVNTIPGAVGYAQVNDAQPYANVASVKIGGRDPGIGAVEQGTYPYWTVEYLYTYGRPSASSLTSAFLSYMASDTASQILRSTSYTPCAGGQQPIVVMLCSTG